MDDTLAGAVERHMRHSIVYRRQDHTFEIFATKERCMFDFFDTAGQNNTHQIFDVFKRAFIYFRNTVFEYLHPTVGIHCFSVVLFHCHFLFLTAPTADIIKNAAILQTTIDAPMGVESAKDINIPARKLTMETATAVATVAK